MDDSESSKPVGWLRPLSLVVAVMSGVFLSLHFWRWSHGFGRWDDVLPGLAFLILALSNVFEKPTKYVLLFISIPILVAAIVMLSIRL
jgi:hypothetical protein